MWALLYRERVKSSAPRARERRAIAALAAILLAVASLPSMAANDDVAQEVARVSTKTEIVGVAFSPDGSTLALDSFGRRTDLWGWRTSGMVLHLPAGGQNAWEHPIVSYSPDGQLVAVCHLAGPSLVNVDVYATATGNTVGLIKDGDCEAIGFTRDGKSLIRLSHVPVDGPGNDIVFSSTSDWLPSAGFRTSVLFAKVAPHVLRYQTVLKAPNRLQIAAGRDDVSLDPDTFSLSPDGKLLAVSGMYSDPLLPIRENHSATAIIDLATKAFTRVFMDEYANDLDWDAAGARLAVAESDAVKVFDVQTGAVLVDQRTEPSRSLVRYTADNKYLTGC